MAKSLSILRPIALHSALCILHCTMSAAMAADIVSAPASFDFDSSGVYTAANGGTVALPYGDGATVSATSPGGVVTTLAAAVNGTNYWTAASGGVWTLENSNEGMAQFCVRYAGAEQGAGTLSDPWKIVDNGELAELIGGGTAADGFAFSTEGPIASLPKMECPVGFMVQPIDGALYRLAAVSGGTRGMSLAASFSLETKAEGPDRRVKSTESPLPFAFSGDGWAFGSDSESTLTFTSPSGDETTIPCIGTGTRVFQMQERGSWIVTLSATGFETLLAHIDWSPVGFVLIVR